MKKVQHTWGWVEKMQAKISFCQRTLHKIKKYAQVMKKCRFNALFVEKMKNNKCEAEKVFEEIEKDLRVIVYAFFSTNDGKPELKQQWLSIFDVKRDFLFIFKSHSALFFYFWSIFLSFIAYEVGKFSFEV